MDKSLLDLIGPFIVLAIMAALFRGAVHLLRRLRDAQPGDLRAIRLQRLLARLWLAPVSPHDPARPSGATAPPAPIGDSA